jgi:hypothetical protein
MSAEGLELREALTNPQSVAVDSSDPICVSGGDSNRVLRRTKLGVIFQIVDAAADDAGSLRDVLSDLIAVRVARDSCTAQ